MALSAPILSSSRLAPEWAAPPATKKTKNLDRADTGSQGTSLPATQATDAGQAGPKPVQGRHIRDRNTKRAVDHGMITMDHASDALSREDVAKILQKALGDNGHLPGQEEVRAVVVEETSDSNRHFHTVFTCRTHRDPRGLLAKLRKVDGQERGAGPDGKPHHLSVQWHHVYAPNDAEVQAGKKAAGAFKSLFPYAAMVKYVLEPSKNKAVDAEPLFINCTRETAADGFAEVERMSATDVVRAARALKRSRVEEGQALEEIVEGAGRATSWAVYPALQAFRATEPDTAVAFLPEGMGGGALDGCRPWQLAFFRWLEEGPITDATGLWLVAPPGSGKTTLMKLCVARYGGDTYFAKERAATNSFDATALIGYEKQKLVVFNDVKASASGAWPHQFMRLLREITDGCPMPFTFGGKQYSPTVQAKIVVNTTEDPPNDPELLRRYQVFRLGSDGAWQLEERGTAGAPSDLYLEPLPGLEPAARQMASWTAEVAAPPPECSPPYKAFMSALSVSGGVGRWLGKLAAAAAKAEPEASTAKDLTAAICGLGAEGIALEEAVGNDADVHHLQDAVAAVSSMPTGTGDPGSLSSDADVWYIPTPKCGP